MNKLGATGLLALAVGCGSVAESPLARRRDPAGGGGAGYVVLDESADFWIVKVWKRGGRAAAERAADELRGTAAETGEKAAPAVGDAGVETADVPSVRGKVRRGSQGVGGCKVKLTPMSRNLGLLQWEESGGVEFDTLTDASGEYRLQRVPAGAYRLKWLLPGASHWVKRLREEPDVVVEAGRTAVAEVDASRPVR